MRTPTVIVITGKPATGKTMIARRLSCDLGIACISKDGIKETLFDTLGWSDVAWSRALGAASSELIYHILEGHLAARQSLMIESNFDPERVTRRLCELQRRWRYRLIQVNCVAAGAVLLERYQQRVDRGERHPGHIDGERVNEKRNHLLHENVAPLDIGGTLFEVDTTDFDAVDFDALADRIRAAIETAGGDCQ